MKQIQILLLDDGDSKVDPIKTTLLHNGIEPNIKLVGDRSGYLDEIENRHYDLIISDSTVADLSAKHAFDLARERSPESPFIVVSSKIDETLATECLKAGAMDYLDVTQLWKLGLLAAKIIDQKNQQDEHRFVPMNVLVQAVSQLSLAKSTDEIINIVRQAARKLNSADGATFILRDGDQCYYIDEDAIQPLWKGQRFPAEACISGWVMNHKRPAIIKDIYSDDRIPVDAYNPTFVKSLLVVPIRTESPIGAIGNYWAHQHVPSLYEIKILQALADSTSVAFESVQLYSDMDNRIEERTAQLEFSKKEMEAFVYSLSHDMTAPLRSIYGFTNILQEDISENLDHEHSDYLNRITGSTQSLMALIDDMLRLFKINQQKIRMEIVNLSRIATDIINELQLSDRERRVEFKVADNLVETGDAKLVRIMLHNLLSNAWKYTKHQQNACIEFGMSYGDNQGKVYFVKDNGEGFDTQKAERLFQPFQRYHSQDRYEGTGIGLSIVQRVINKHGGKVWAESSVNSGSTFYFTLQGHKTDVLQKLLKAK